MKRSLDEDYTLYLYYYEQQNVFTDIDGIVIYNIFEIITPNDLFLFRHDSGFNYFPFVGDKEWLVEIITVPDEVCGWQETLDFIDFGDDLERVNRYEIAKTEGCF